MRWDLTKKAIMMNNRCIIRGWILLIAASFCIASACSKKTVAGSGGNDIQVVVPPPAPKDTLPTVAAVKGWLVDKNATDQTAALFYNLKKISKTNILFGHQDATKRGVTNAGTQWANEQHLPAVSREKSDIKEVAGAYPSVYGHDFLHIANFTDGNWFQYEGQIARELTIDAYNRGGVNTYAWHYNNPVSKGSFYWNDSPVEAVSQILPGGTHAEVYKHSLKEVAAFAKSLSGSNGTLVPIIFRPFHEFDGSWFWWGATHCTPQQYKSLYQFTVTYLRDSLQVRNFLYVNEKYKKLLPEELKERRKGLLVILKNNLFFSGKFFRVLVAAIKGYLHFKMNKFSS
ncbi:MAG: hypothetical protein EOP48_11700 [Sphingobacteriales bacterium]|nr:MAG: hypothetical protein EOP48_11700 [Sphingobacteriales bacterium]